ncbi:trans-sialidase [Trypanosoma cruzi]|nr:trans-sialidase [Trypanosoma cruzi]
MLQDGNKGSVYVDGVIVGSPETITTLETLGHEITHFYFLGCEGDIKSDVTVTKVFLYNRPLSVGELKMVKKSDAKKGNSDGSMRGGRVAVAAVRHCGPLLRNRSDDFLPLAGTYASGHALF